MIKMDRIWAMPNKWTFKIPPIKKLVDRYVGDGVGWVDPFAGENSPAEITNDLNPSSPAMYHTHALEFVEHLDHGVVGVLFDPPYSLRQVKECYDSIGVDMSFADSTGFPTNVKRAIGHKILPGGLAISFGWNSGGFGKTLGFGVVEILIVPHGGNHNDTIVTVERKMNTTLSMFGA